MILLNEHSLTYAGKLVKPYALKLDLTERGSTAGADVLGTEAPPALGQWIKSRSGPAAGIVWRVKGVEDSRFNGATYLIQLEHIINTLKDRILPGETKPANITGDSNAAVCTARQAIQYILARQQDWRLGVLEADAVEAYSFHGENLFSALETVCSTLDNVYWDYDLSRWPFTLNIRKINTDVMSEMRMQRNVTGTIKYIIDRMGMYTRIYPTGKNNLKLPEGSLSRNTDLYGEIEHPETDQSIDTVEALRSWALNRLRNHCEPKVMITVTGLWLSEQTGEALDRLTLNRTCRIPLPKYGTKIQERITKLSWSDAIAEPEAVTVTLANNLTDVANILRNMEQSSGRAGRISAVNAEEDHAWFEDTTDHVAMVAEAIIGQSPDGVDWKRVAEVIVDGNGIHQRVTKTEGDIVVAQTAIEANENAITLEAQRAAGAEGALSGRITVEADRITQEVSRATAAEGTLSGRITVEADRITQEVSRATAAEGSLSGRITTEAGKVAMVVEEKDGQNVIKAASIVTAVNSAGSSVAIAADHVSIAGDTKLSGTMTIDNGSLVVKKSAVFQGNVTLTDANGYIQAKKFAVASGGSVQFIGSGTGESYSLTASNIQGFIKEASVDGNVLTLTPVHGDPITFSKAVSLSGEWNSNVYTVTASPQGTTLSTSVNSRFGVNEGVYYIEAYRSSDSGAPGISGASITYKLANNEGTIEIQDASGNRIADTPTISASSGTTLSGAWSSDTYTVTASPQGDTLSTSVNSRFGVNEGVYYIEAYRSSDSGAPGISGASVTYQMANNAGTVELQDSNGSRISDTPTLALDVEETTITANGTYTPSGSNVGFSKVVVNVPSSSSTYLYKTLAWGGGTYSGQEYTSMEYMTKNSSDDTMADHDYRYFVNDYSRNCVRVYTTLGQSGFSGQEHVFNMDPFVSHISISFSENTTDRSKVSGATSLSFRQDVADAVNGRKYCIFTAKLEGADTSKKYYFDFT